MLECIKRELEATRDRLISIKNQEIASKTAEAEQNFIAPKFQEFEQQKAEQLALAQKDYEARISAINNTVEQQKIMYRKDCIDKITAAVESGFAAEIADINKKLGV